MINENDLLFVIYDYLKFDDIFVNYEILKENLHFDSKVFMISNAEEQYRNIGNKLASEILYLRKNIGYKYGAFYMIKKSLLLMGHKKFEYIILLAADVWLKDKNFVFDSIKKMEKEGSNVFLLKAQKFDKKEIFRTAFTIFKKNDFVKLNESGPYGNGCEESLTRWIRKDFKSSSIACKDGAYRDITDINGAAYKKFFHKSYYQLFHSHNPIIKKEFLEMHNIINGENIQKLLASEDLDYFNNGIKRQRKTIEYGYKLGYKRDINGKVI